LGAIFIFLLQKLELEWGQISRASSQQSRRARAF